MAAAEPMRGEVWDVNFPGIGMHPSVVLSVNALNIRLGHVAVIPITGTRGPEVTHVALGAEAGLTRYPESYADVTELQPIARRRFRRRRGLANRDELDRLEQRLRVYLGL
ncbi:type II toxin-antitoxin system PemK/MazF family toxin [Sporichthya sp.]|uniref:type II toxin-antitoxin system PemK/MazF family toxin n=1 Tax=Sporichthya sp. TaxID=65475 RepID=UPI0017C1F6F4|nr:type II toxin-antitoxin system PemK/MazF family toxin [Sporichthya sp.]MBA3742314.1 type II toxin-antitoxin system PemK/MazF family toxin [Sporichthya sp.]